MSIKYPAHIWATTPQCPHCEADVEWEDGDEGGPYQPPYDGFWQCDECDKTWGAEGPSAAEYAGAELERAEATSINGVEEVE